MNLLKFLLTNQLKLPKQTQKTGGFTLIELLVGIVLAFLVITPLLGFMVNIMQTDRNEEAKANSEQEIQAALDYISRDLQQAVYIYKDTALTTSHADIPATGTIPTSGIQDQIPPGAGAIAGCPDATSCVPVLAFWKLENRERVVPVQACTTSGDSCNNDAKVYSLVVYYRIQDATCSATSTWSCAARIGRFEIHDGVRGNTPDARNTAEDDSYLDPTANSPLAPDQGFKVFNLEGQGTLTEKMNAWTKSGDDYTKPMEILVDYIDKAADGFSANSIEHPNPDPNVVDPIITTSISIRGNALARIRKSSPLPSYNASVSAYFPQSSIEIKEAGLLNNQ